MKKKLLMIALLLVGVITLAGCGKTKNENGLKFKEEYEALNGLENANGKVHRTITIDESNPIVYATAEEIVEKLNNGESFYVYFGDTACPWCRSVIEKAIKVAKENKISKIYYVKIWAEDHEEILRDTYKLDDNHQPELVKEGTTAYYELLSKFDTLLRDYTLSYTSDNGETTSVEVGEKRIFAPTFIKVEKGSGIKMTTGISELQNDSREELSDEVLNDEETMFKELFN